MGKMAAKISPRNSTQNIAGTLKEGGKTIIVPFTLGMTRDKNRKEVGLHNGTKTLNTFI